MEKNALAGKHYLRRHNLVKQTITFVPNQWGGRLIYRRDIPANENYWDGMWAKDQTKVRAMLPRRFRRIFQRYVKPGASVLEAGCGLAAFTVAAHRLGYKAEGMDYAPDVINRLKSEFPQIRFFSGDVRNLIEVADASYDVVFSPGVCEHFEEGPEQILSEMVRITKPGGILLVSTPCNNALRRFYGRTGRFDLGQERFFYQYAFSEAEMTAILTSLGVDVLETQLAGALTTMRSHLPLVGRVPLGPLANIAAVLLDALPMTRNWGHSCVWVARKRVGSSD